MFSESIFNVTSPLAPPSDRPLPATTEVMSPPPPPPAAVNVIVSPEAFVVIVILLPAANVSVSVAPSATTLSCPATAIVLNASVTVPPPSAAGAHSDPDHFNIWFVDGDVLLTFDKFSIGIAILPVPSKDTPAIVLAVSNAVAVAAFPDVF